MFQPCKVISLALRYFKRNIQITLTGNESHFLHNIFTNPSSYWLVCLKLIFVMRGFLCKNVMKMQTFPVVEWWNSRYKESANDRYWLRIWQLLQST